MFSSKIAMNISIIMVFVIPRINASDIPQASSPSPFYMLLEKYNALSPEACGAAISKATKPGSILGAEHECACLVAGYRKVVVLDEGEMLMLADDIKRTVESFVNRHVIKKVTIFGNDTIWYHADDDNERSALLLAKYLMLNNFCLAQPVVEEGYSTNRWLAGTLFGYAPEDIDYYYQREEFLEHLQAHASAPDAIRLVAENPYSVWSPEIKQAFDDFLFKGKWWLHVEADRRMGKQFIDQQTTKFPTIERLRASVERANQHIESLSKEYVEVETLMHE